MGVWNEVRRNAYFDSVVLMRIASQLSSQQGVTAASLMMGTAANKELLLEAGLLSPAGESAGANDLIVAIDSSDDFRPALAQQVESALEERPAGQLEAVSPRAGTLREACGELGGANLAVISTPGVYAAGEALKALRLGLNVFLFSDNVPLAQELMLKREAEERDLVVMGPDSGTSILNGVPLGFANQVRRGPVGLIGASGTGLQMISSLIHRWGSGISQAIGVGGRDLSADVGGRSMLFALEALDADPETRVIVLVSKPPASQVAGRILERAASATKPVVVNFLGFGVTPSGNVTAAATLEDAAAEAVYLAEGRRPDLAQGAVPALPSGGGRQFIRAVYSGGTFAYEAEQLLAGLSGEVATTVGGYLPGRIPELPAGHLVLDTGADEYTVGRPHPMIDPAGRLDFVRAASQDPSTAVLLLDVVLGYNAAANPARDLVTALDKQGGPTVIAFVCGTDEDPQSLDRQEAILRDAGVVVVETSTAAVKLALRAMLAGPMR